MLQEKLSRLQLLCDDISEESITNVHYLSLYGNKLQKLPGIGCFSSSPLQTLNVGRNLLPSLPLEASSNFACLVATTCQKYFAVQMRSFSHLEVLWADDNQFTEVPEVYLVTVRASAAWQQTLFVQCIFHLKTLKTLRLSGNKITSLPSDIEKLSELEELALDGNELLQLPAELASLTKLRKLLVQYASAQRHLSCNQVQHSNSQIEQINRNTHHNWTLKPAEILGNQQ